MKLFRSNNHPARPTSLKFGGSVWKIIPDVGRLVIYIESREPETRQVKFYAVDLIKKKIIWEYLDKEERWWLGLEAYCHGTLFLHGYKNPKFPEHKGIIALNAQTGRVIWKNSSWIYLQNAGADIVVATEEVDKYFLVDTKKGNVINEVVSTQFSTPIGKEKEEIVSGHVIKEDQEVYLKIKHFVSTHLSIEVVQSLTYLEHAGHLIISFYSVDEEAELSSTTTNESVDMSNKFLMQRLWIVDREGREKMLMTLGKKLKGISSDPFFVFQNMVIFLVEKNELVIYGLE